MAPTTDTSFSHKLSNMTARHCFTAKSHFGIDFHDEIHLATKLFQSIHCARSLMSEMEIKALMCFENTKTLVQDVVRKLVGRHQREVACERQHEYCIQPCLAQQT